MSAFEDRVDAARKSMLEMVDSGAAVDLDASATVVIVEAAHQMVSLILAGRDRPDDRASLIDLARTIQAADYVLLDEIYAAARAREAAAKAIEDAQRSSGGAALVTS